MLELSLEERFQTNADCLLNRSALRALLTDLLKEHAAAGLAQSC